MRPSADFIAEIEVKVQEKFSHSTVNRQYQIDAFQLGLRQVLPQDNLTTARALENFFTIIELLKISQKHKFVSEQDQRRLIKLAENSLKFCNIKPITSQLSYLYTKLYMELSRNLRANGQAWVSISYYDIAKYLGRDSLSHESLSDFLLRGLQAWQLGYIRTAKLVFHHVEQMKTDIPSNRIARWYLIRSYRLSGEIKSAEHLLATASLDYVGDAEWQEVLRFESVLLRAQIAESALELQQIVLRDQMNVTSYDLLRAQLWIYASQLKDGAEKRSSFKKMRENYLKKADNSFTSESDFRLLQFIENCYDSNVPLQQRLENLGKKLSETTMVHDPEVYSLFLAASIRWLYRIKQLSFASMLIEEYRSQSLKFSDGRLLDALGILGEIIDKLPVITDQIPSPVQLKLYTGVTPRFIAISQVIAKCLFLLAQYKLTPKNSDEEAEKIRHNVNLQVAKIIEECVGKLKGPLMKIIQLSGASKYLSLETRQIMCRIYDSSSPCSFEELKIHGEKDLGRTFESAFAEFDINPLAVASIGQVFRGTTQDGDSVAIKIMYPKIEKIIQSDLTIMKILIPFIRQLLPNTDMEQVWKQLLTRFQKECNYQFEKENQLAFYNIFNNHSHIKIPKIFQELCSQRVFVTEFIEGDRLDEYLESASQEQKNHIAAQILRFHIEAIFVHGLWHIDPHPGNFIVSEDRLVVLDFGAIFRTDSISTDFQRVRTLCSLNNDSQRFYKKICDLNLINREVLSFDLFQKELSHHFFSPFHIDEVRPYFYGGDTRNAGDVVIKSGLSHAFLFKAEDLFPFTIQQYIGDLLTSTGAKLNWHQLLQSIINEITPGLVPSSQ